MLPTLMSETYIRLIKKERRMLMQELQVKGTQEFMGMDIPVITGGFGDDKKIVTALGIANIHNLQLKEVTKSINRLIEKKRLSENVDYIDVVSQVNSLPMDIETIFYLCLGQWVCN